jgi:EAL domain-containing protein (putative c-di-GMP-specific phosphodiesterase class I)
VINPANRERPDQCEQLGGSAEWKEFPVPLSTDGGPWKGHTPFAIARQPIFGLRGRVYGYELLFRDRMANSFSGDRDQASQTLANRWESHNLSGLTGDGLPFVNCTRNTLLAGWAEQFPRGTVLEILEDVEPDQAVLEVCYRLKTAGYRIALDDFQYSDKMVCLVEIADYIKIDFRALNPHQRDTTLFSLRGFSGALVAEKLETGEEYCLAREQGFVLFQGFFLALPEIFLWRGSLAGVTREPMIVNEFGPITPRYPPVALSPCDAEDSPLAAWRPESSTDVGEMPP